MEYKACKDCKHFHTYGPNPNAVCFRPREKTNFDPINGVMLEVARYDVFDERNDDRIVIGSCGLHARYFEEAEK